MEINGENYKRYPRSVRLAIAAALDASRMSNLAYFKPHRVAVIIGTAAGAIVEIEQNAATDFDLRVPRFMGFHLLIRTLSLVLLLKRLVHTDLPSP